MDKEFRAEMGEHVRGALMYLPPPARREVKRGCSFNLIDRNVGGKYVPREIAYGGLSRIDLILDRDSCVMRVTYTVLHECAHHVLDHGKKGDDPEEIELEANRLVGQWIAPHAGTIEFKGKVMCGECWLWNIFCRYFEK